MIQHVASSGPASGAIPPATQHEAGSMNPDRPTSRTPMAIALFAWVARHLALSAALLWVVVFGFAWLSPSLFMICLPLMGLAVLLSGAAFLGHLRRR